MGGGDHVVGDGSHQSTELFVVVGLYFRITLALDTNRPIAAMTIRNSGLPNAPQLSCSGASAQPAGLRLNRRATSALLGPPVAAVGG